jgi:hypothetical protein
MTEYSLVVTSTSVEMKNVKWSKILMVLAIFSCSTALMPMRSFQPVGLPAPLLGTYLCATQRPSLVLNEDDMQTGMDRFRSGSVPLQVLCSYQCTTDSLCKAFNFIDYPVPLCQLYHFAPTSCALVFHCTYYAVRVYTVLCSNSLSMVLIPLAYGS